MTVDADLPDAADGDDRQGTAVYRRLCDDLMQGRLAPDERLKIRDLAEMMGTSVTPVRDAVLRLVQDGALMLKSPRDIRVRRIGLNEYLEIRALRVELEGMAAAAAASRATPSDLVRLESLMARNEQALNAERFVDAVALNQAFHFEYCSLSGMPLLLQILRGLWLRMGPLIARSYESGGRDMVDHHYPLLAALRAHDAKAARLAVKKDIIEGGSVILQTLQRQNAPEP